MRPASCSAAQRLDQLGDGLLGVTDDRHVGLAVLADLGRVDVGVHDQRVAARSVDSWPVTRSSKRAPRATRRSAFCSAVTAVTLPCMPGMPRFCGWLSGKAPRAISVVTTGAPVSSASSASSSVAPALSTPPPT